MGGVNVRCVRARGMEMCLRHWAEELSLPPDVTAERVVEELERQGVRR